MTVQYTIIPSRPDFLTLPDEIILDILSYLPVQERLKSVARVCQRLYSLAYILHSNKMLGLGPTERGPTDFFFLN